MSTITKEVFAVPDLVVAAETRSQEPLRSCVLDAMETYLQQLGDQMPTNVYAMVMREVEVPLLQAMLRHCRGNQSRAATMLGINRGTLRKKLKDYGL